MRRLEYLFCIYIIDQRGIANMDDDRRSNNITRDRIDELREERVSALADLRRELLHAIMWIRLGVLVIGITSILAIIITVRLNRDRIDDLQDQRRTSISTSCHLQNQRHDNTIAKLNQIVRQDPHPENRRGIEATIALIDALVPISDCKALVKKSTGE